MARRKERPAEIVARRKAQAESVRRAKVAGVLAVIGVVGFVYARFSMTPPPPPPQRASLPPQDVVHNSPFDGSVRQVERYLKKTLKDPGSFQAVEWGRVQKDTEGYTVRLRYRARNSFGAMVLSDQVFLLDRLGNVIP